MGRHRLAQQPLMHQRQLWAESRPFHPACAHLRECSSTRVLIEQVFAISEQRAHQKIFLKELVPPAATARCTAQPRAFDNRHLGGPVMRPNSSRAWRCDSCVRSPVAIARSRSLSRAHDRCLTHLDWILPGAPAHRPRDNRFQKEESRRNFSARSSLRLSRPLTASTSGTGPFAFFGRRR